MSFDLKARTWDIDREKHERAALFAEQILIITKGSRINNAFEFGSGTALVSINLKDRFGQIVLADTSMGMLEVVGEKALKEGAGNMILYHLNESNPLESAGRFDLVYTLLALHHVKDVEKTFGDFFRILNPGGWLIIGDLVTEDGSFHSNDPDFDGHNGFDPEEMKQRLSASGFETKYHTFFYTIKREKDSAVKEYPLFILGAVKKG